MKSAIHICCTVAGEGTLPLGIHQILGMVSKKVQSESGFGACNTHTCWNWTKVTPGGVCRSLVNNSYVLNGQVLIENK
jgi:hypothetical protein